MGLRNSVLKHGEQQSVTKHKWYREKNITDLNWHVRLFDILELELSNEPPHYRLLLVIGRFELVGDSDLQVAYIISDRNDPECIVLYPASLREVIADRRVRIYKTDRSKIILKARNRYDETIDGIMFRVIGQFLGNKSVEPLISSLVEEITQFSDETVEDIQSLVTNLVKVALRLLIGLASQGFTDLAERNKEEEEGTGWFDKNNIIESELRACDRLEFSRLFYSHWGMFLGKLGDTLLVLHFSTTGSGKKYSIKKTSGLGSSAMDKPAYRIDSIKKPLGNRRMRINNGLDKKYPPSVPDKILDAIVYRLASQSFQRSPEYDALHNNCEHLVNELRYKKHHSEQLPPILGPFAERLNRILCQS